MSEKNSLEESCRWLTDDETTRLSTLETKIESGLKTFVEVGDALLEIRESRLYRQTHGTFEDYCQERWQMTQQSATRLCRSAAAVNNLKSEPIGSLPVTESQTRPLTVLSPEQQPEAWKRAVEIAGGTQPTARQVQQAVEEIKPDSEEITNFKSAWAALGRTDRMIGMKFVYPDLNDDERDKFSAWISDRSLKRERERLLELANR